MTWKYKNSILSIGLWLTLLSSTSAAVTPTSADPKALHLLNRLAFGPRPGDIERVHSMGIDAYIQEQLSPEKLPDPQNLTRQLSEIKSLKMTPNELLQAHPTKQQSPIVLEETVKGRLLRAIESPRQLQEVLVDFWYNHFNVYVGKGLDRRWVGAYETEAIRPHILGQFRDLLEATAQHPAMLVYLDNWENTAPGKSGAQGRFMGLNENYARELMELHTLGVDGGYSQQDVMALAKIFTGWGFCKPAPQKKPVATPGSDYRFCFDAKRHDFSNKVFLGKQIKGSGIAEGEQALDILVSSPVTARRISYLLAQYFVADQPPAALVDRLAQRFSATKGNLKEVLQTLFRSPEFLDPKYYNAKFKTPYHYVISAVRLTGRTVTNVKPLYSAMSQMGMPPYGHQAPTGYKNTKEAWLSPDGMARRLSFATALASGCSGSSDEDPKNQGSKPKKMAAMNSGAVPGKASKSKRAVQAISSPTTGLDPVMGEDMADTTIGSDLAMDSDTTMISGTPPNSSISKSKKNMAASSGISPKSKGSGSSSKDCPVLRDNSGQPVPADSLVLSQTIETFLSDKTKKAISESLPELRGALILGSPEFMYR